MVSVLQRARDSGRCPPSLLTEDKEDPDGFENDVTRLLDTAGFGLSDDAGVAEVFEAAVKKASNLDSIQDSVQRASVLEQRRCLLLAIAGSTVPSSKTLERILTNGYLTTIKGWLDDTLSGRVGGVDLLLHMLTNMISLPVTKSLVKNSGMGKAIGAIEKHPLCKGSLNEAVIQQRVASIKDAWQASVKARKSHDSKDSPVPTKRVVKREASPPTTNVPISKRAKVEHGASEAKKSTFAALLEKVSGGNSGGSRALSSRNGLGKPVPQKGDPAGSKKKSSNRVKWCDHFGGALEKSRVIEGEDTAASEPSTVSAVSWTDRKKRDRAREKELLASVKKAKLLDDEGDEPPLPVGGMKTTIQWSTPSLIPELSDLTKPVLNSTEIQAQNDRARVVAPAHYFAESEVPTDPTSMSEVEQALDMTSQSSAVVQSIPFFVPQQPATAPVDTPPVSVNPFGPSDSSTLLANPQAATLASSGASPELLQALGLPMFLVGQDVQALQTLASSPGLLSTMVDANGMYDQTRLLSLVQTLSGTPSHHDPSAAYQSVNTAAVGGYGLATPSIPAYSPSSTYGGGPSAGSLAKSDEGNLHIAGFGPGTTQTDIITLFLPYVKVTEVVLKGSFAFVNTGDPVNAQRAKEALQGTLLNGMPVRINAAQRKAKDSSSTYGQSSASTYGPSVGAGTPMFAGTGTPTVVLGGANTGDAFGAAPPAPSIQQPQLQQHQSQLVGAQENVDHVRDDRGNPATKNLFVAGYGPGTSEQQLRDIFNQHSNVIGVVLKGNFAFVNTSTRQEAVNARQMLQGSSISGGTLRINFAKETGRLGTSFDLTYNQQSGPNARRGSTAPSYYGRGF